MKKLVLIIALSLFLPASGLPQDATGSQAAFERASQSIFDWLQRISRSLDEFVATERRDQLRQRLRTLNQSLYEVEASKLVLLLDMKQSTGLPAELQRMQRNAGVVAEKIDHLRHAIHDVAILLREQFQQEGLDCEILLSSATGERKTWLFQLSSDPSLLSNRSTKEELINRGEHAVSSLRDASLELASLTHRLEAN